METSNAFFIGCVFFRVNYSFVRGEVEDGLEFMVLEGGGGGVSSYVFS